MRQLRVGADLLVVAVAACALVAGCAADNEPDVDRAALEEDIAAHLKVSTELAPVRALVVLHDGATVFEEYYGSTPTEYHDTESVTKSVMGTLVGIAIDEGSLAGVDQTLDELLPSYAGDMSPAVARTTLAQLLTMTGGFSDTTVNGMPAFLAADDAVAAILANGRGGGTRFRYTNEGAHLISAILVEATGMSTLEFARARLLDPLGVDSEPAVEPLIDPESVPAYDRADFAWPVDQQRLNSGYGFVKLQARDLASLGQLYLDEGRWEGEQVVSAGWVRAATSPQAVVAAPEYGYGYLWWTDEVGGDPAYSARGTGGQVIRVVPDRGLVVVVASEYDLLDSTAPEADLNAVTFLTDEVIAPHFAQ